MTELVYKEVDPKYEDQVKSIINKVLGNLERPEFFIPYSDWELESLFDKNYALLHGAYDGEKLVGIAQLYVKQDFLKEYKEVLDITDKKVSELGGDLVLPEYRGRGIMTKLIKIQTDLANSMGFDYIISMAHPENLNSNKALQKIGLKYIKTTTVSNGYLRDVYMMRLR